MDLTDKELEALKRWEAGLDPYFSTGYACGELTAGYGALDAYGYWEYPLPGPAEEYRREVFLRHDW